MYFINYFSAMLDYYEDSDNRTVHISGPDLTAQDVQQMLISKQEYLVPGFTKLYLYHGLWFFDEPGQDDPLYVKRRDSRIMFGNYNYDSLKTYIQQDTKYADYKIINNNNYSDYNTVFYVSYISPKGKIITLNGLLATAIIDPKTLKQISPVDNLQTDQKHIAPALNKFFKPIPEINPIPQNKQLKFVENCRQFEDWVRSQKKANIK